ncbi:PDC sensor domain-containing protein [Dickeya dadantii]|uniref:PDC sensor domain-containing protein n=1 Tax=Dickeya dadantii TaxID=204038 RepID=UPI001C0CCC06|nr:PDC sensor domain-containing protein [Dickeya dadantii]QWT42371.1 PDC sensor domain-containing protein [Dickeya dadantii]
MSASPSRTALAEALFASLIFIGLLGFSTYMVYHKSISTLEQEIKIGLLSNVRAAASTLSGELHQDISARTERDDPVYQQLAVQLERIRQASQDVRYIYTTVLDQDQVRFVVNPSPQNDNDGDGQPDLPPALMQVYDNAPSELVEALREHKTAVSAQPYRDEWGSFISAYAPFYDRQGAFRGVLAMDLELSSFYQRLEALNQVFRKAISTILFLGLVVGLAVWWMRRSSQQVRVQLASREQAYHALLHAASPSQLERLYDWPLPLLFLRGGDHQRPPAYPTATAADPLPSGSVQAQQANLDEWWRNAAPSLLPCPDSVLAIATTEALEAHFSPDSCQHFWQQSFQLWRQLAQQPLTIEVSQREEALLHWVLDVRLTRCGEPDGAVAEDPDWWQRFLRWQAEAESVQVTIRQATHGQLLLSWQVPKYPEAL